METTTKICTKCKIEKSITEFYTKNKKPISRCKKCDNEKRKINNIKAKLLLTKEQIDNKNLKRRLKYNEPNSQYKERLKREKKKYYETNKIKLKEDVKNYKNTYIGKIVKINSHHKRRALLKQGDVTTKQLKDLYDNNKNCYWCGVKLFKENTHLDHLMPFKLGGKHTISNLVLACYKCNLKKQGRDPLEFAKTLDESLKN